MKGTRQSPQCGFSAATIDILDKYIPEYETVDVLRDADLREAVKKLTQWPTIPQVFVRGEFIGGADIIGQLDEAGELLQALGDVAEPAKPPEITITQNAAAAIKTALASVEGDHGLRLEINSRYHNDLYIGPEQPGDVSSTSNGVTLTFDPASARRAHGLHVDFLTSEEGSGFKLENPNAPPDVRELTVAALKEKMDAGDDFEFIDVRTVSEREKAKIEGSRLLDGDVMKELEALPKDTPLVFHCHHGGRSFQAAQHFVGQGFTEVYNVAGGIDAWSRSIDPDVPRY